MYRSPHVKKVILVSGIFPPEPGGPATHVAQIASHLHDVGMAPVVITFGKGTEAVLPYKVIFVPRNGPKVFRWARYLLEVVIASRDASLVYAFDLTTAGLPAMCVKILYAIPFIIRVGGDPVWERIVESGSRNISLREYHAQGLSKKDKPILTVLITAVLRSADIAVLHGDALLTRVLEETYGLHPDKVFIIRNPLPEKASYKEEASTRTVLFAGRFVAYKNLHRLIEAFLMVQKRFEFARLTLVGDGPDVSDIKKLVSGFEGTISVLPRTNRRNIQLMIDESSVGIAPGITEFTPNFILECIARGKPILISKDHGLTLPFPPEWEFDPLRVDDIVRAITHMISVENYARAVQTVRDIPYDMTWQSVLHKQELLIRSKLREI